MSYTRLNPKPTLDIAFESVSSPSVSISSGSWGDATATIPEKTGYTPIGVARVELGSPSSLTLIGFNMSSDVVKARMRNMTSSSGSWGAIFTIAYAKVS